MNVDCEVIQDLIPLYLDGAASPRTRVVVDEHLRECAACRAYLAKARQPVVPAQASLDPGTPEPQNPEIVSYARRIKSRRRTIAIVAGVILLALLLTVATLGLALYLLVQSGPPTTSSNIADYGHFEKRDRYSNLEIFPRTLPASTQNPRYFYRFQDVMFDASFQIYLETTLSEADYQAEVERLSKIAVSYKGETHPIVYDTQSFAYPAYVTAFAHNLTYEYALLIEKEHKIVYVFTQFGKRQEIGFDPRYLPEAFQSPGDPNVDTLGGFNIYYFDIGNGVSYMEEKEWKLGQ